MAEIESDQFPDKAAEQGHAVAQHNLGCFYLEGEDVPKDYNQALKWFTKAARKGFVSAQNNLAVMYFLGQGVPRDIVETYAWFLIVSLNGRPGVEDKLEKELTPDQLAAGQARAKELQKKMEQ